MTTRPPVSSTTNSRLGSFSSWHLSSLPSSSTLLSRRTSIYSNEDRVVLDIGSRNLKVGFSGEPRPRKILAFEGQRHTNVCWDDLYDLDWMRSGRDITGAETTLCETLQEAFFRYLLTDPKQRTVVLCETPMMPIRIKEMIAKILFHRLQVPALCFVPSHLLALLTTGESTGLVIDCGHLETTVLPIYFARPLMTSVQMTPLAGRAVTETLRDLLKSHARIIQTSAGVPTSAAPRLTVPDHILSSDRLEDIKSRCILIPHGVTNVSSSDQEEQHCRSSDIYYRLENDIGGGTLWIPGYVREKACTILFTGDPVEEIRSIGECILDCLLKVPTDLRKPLGSSLLMVGGTTMIPGYQARLLQELNHLLDHVTKYKRLAGIELGCITDRGAGRVFTPSCRTWIGGSLVGTLKMAGATIQREKFDGSVPDWTMVHSPTSTNTTSSSTSTSTSNANS
ncbi:actin family [Phascolomyces articulosus]|uniref:Actin family n=1 Tax=Phascolomyces articulosus TaxID=60185 RepID=A0AAD5K7P0_9FUNG|nr:actin family [Phascolomyces articulosus]